MIVPFKEVLLTRHAANETICVSAYKVVDGKFVVSERFCNGVDQAADLIQRSFERPDIGAIWTNIQRLKPGSDKRRKGETIDSYTNIVIDIDRKIKKIDGQKINATDAEREVLYAVALEVVGFLSPKLGTAVIADSGNGYHLSWHLNTEIASIPPAEGQALYTRLLTLLKAKFEKPELNMEIDASLADDTQVVTVWGTWNRKYPDTPDRPQRQSKIVYMPRPVMSVSRWTLEQFVLENTPKDTGSDLDSQPVTPAANVDKNMANHEWAAEYGVPDLVEFFEEFIEFESESYEKGGDTHHPIKPCYCHKDSPRDHSHEKDCEIIEFADGGIGVSCFSRDHGLKTMVKLLNEAKGEKYPHLIFAEESAEDLIKTFGVQDADAVSPVGKICYKENCDCGLVHVAPQKPLELFEDGEFELVRRGENRLIGITMDKVKSHRLEPLWEGWIPTGKGVVMHGPPGCGKSFVALSFIATITTGGKWPDGAENKMGARRVLIAATEDDAEDTIKPRLLAAGADLTKVIWLMRAENIVDNKRRKMNLIDDTNTLHQMLKENPDIAAVVLDPITGFYGETEGNANKQIRPMMEHLAEVCRKTKVNVFAIIHENRRGDAAAIDKILGAGALGQVFRVVLRFDNDRSKKETKGKIMATTKVNLTKKEGGFRYHIAEKEVALDDGGRDMIGYCQWDEEHKLTADDALAENKAAARAEEFINLGATTGVEKALELLKANMKPGERKPLTEIHRLAEENGFPPTAEGKMNKTLQRASYQLKVIRSKAPGPFFWTLPETVESIEAEKEAKETTFKLNIAAITET